MKLQELKQGLLYDGEFRGDYERKVYLALFYSELSDERMEQATKLRKQIDCMVEEYERLINESNEYINKFEEIYSELNNEEE